MIKVKTNEPIIHNRDKITQQIARFWDQISDGWRLLWGEHIHHGFYENELPISPEQAQEKLILKLIELLHLKNSCNILDVGCGMGGSSIYLAKNYHASVTGITLSPKQVTIATNEAHKQRVNNVNFKIEDALSLTSLKDNTFDIVWSLESCEQFFDKTLFIEQAFRVLKPGGQLMLATWCSSHEEYENKLASKYQKLCLAFDVPYMPTIKCYNELLKQKNFVIGSSLDWTPFVKQSWDIGLSRLNAYSILQILRMGGIRGLLFAKQIKLMRAAFYENRVQYGVFIANKPG